MSWSTTAGHNDAVLPIAVRDLIAAAVPPDGMNTTVLAVDGYGGAGKSTLAGQIADAHDATIVHTDDFAAWDNPIDWWPRLRNQVLIPLGHNEKAHYQRYDWATAALAEWHDITPGGLVVVEGVTSSRFEFQPFLAGTIWIETPAELRLQRGLDRDGDQARDQWLAWMAAERQWGEANRPWDSADLVLPGY